MAFQILFILSLAIQCLFCMRTDAQEIQVPSARIDQLDHIRTELLRGKEIDPHLREISSFLSTIYREYPYFYDALPERWDFYIQSYSASRNSIVCIARQDDKIIGMSIGAPLAESAEKYNTAFTPYQEYYDSLFYLGELAVQPEFRRMGLGTQLYEHFERVVKQDMRFSGICFWQYVENGDNEPLKPHGYTSPLPLFQKLGFQPRPDIFFYEPWKNTFGTEKVPHLMSCWMKQL